MAFQAIDVDTVQPNGKLGDPARTAFVKVNGNFVEVYGLISGLAPTSVVQTIATDLATETAARTAADTALQQSIDTKAATTALTAETNARTNADTALQQAINTKAAITDLTAVSQRVDSAFSVLSGRNLLINCGRPVNQRVFAGGALAAGVFGYDRWRAGAGGCNISINATTGLYTHTSGTLQQVVEDPENAWGRALTISVEDPSRDLSVNVGGVAATITAGAGRRSVTVTPTGSGNMTVNIFASAATTYLRPQLERGSVATQFEYLPRGTVLSQCRQYWRKTYNLDVAPGTNTLEGCVTAISFNTTFIQGVSFGEPMRAAPAVTVYGDDGVSGVVKDLIGANAATGVAAQFIGAGGFLRLNTFSGTVANLIYRFHLVMNAELP